MENLVFTENAPKFLWQQPCPEILTLEVLAAEPHKSAIGAYWATVQLLSHVFATSSYYDPSTGQSTSQSLQQTLKMLSSFFKNIILILIIY